jgi:hypothetical protein
VPNRPKTSEIWQAIASKEVDLARELKIPAIDVVEIQAVLGRQDGFEPVDTDRQDMQRHGAQLAGEFLIDRRGIVRWAHIERAEAVFPTDEEILAAARALPRCAARSGGRVSGSHPNASFLGLARAARAGSFTRGGSMA